MEDKADWPRGKLRDQNMTAVACSPVLMSPRHADAGSRSESRLSSVQFEIGDRPASAVKSEVGPQIQFGMRDQVSVR